MRLAIIPARGGSKRIPRKNIKEFCGIPIMAYPIAAALDAGFDAVMVSTEDDEIADIAKQFGADVPFRRHAETAGDHTGTVEVLLEVLGEYAKQRVVFDHICCIYPCNPFLTAAKLEDGLAMHLGSEADSTFPVVQYSYPIQRSLRIDDGRAVMRWPENYAARSQDLEPTYHDAGQFYWLNTAALRQQKKLFMAKSTPLITPETEVQDIDTLTDWTLAEVKYQLWRNNSNTQSNFGSSLLGPETKGH